MNTRCKSKRLLLALSGALTLGSLAGAAPADAGYRHGWGGYHDDVVHRPVVRRVVVVDRPVSIAHAPSSWWSGHIIRATGMVGASAWSTGRGDGMAAGMIVRAAGSLSVISAIEAIEPVILKARVRLRSAAHCMTATSTAPLA